MLESFDRFRALLKMSKLGEAGDQAQRTPCLKLYLLFKAL